MKPKKQVTPRAAAVGSSVLLGCGLVSIITPQVGRWRMSRIETESDVVLAWDGKELLMLKNRYGANLEEVSPALRRIAEAAPTAGWG